MTPRDLGSPQRFTKGQAVRLVNTKNEKLQGRIGHIVYYDIQAKVWKVEVAMPGVGNGRQYLNV